MIGHYKQTKVTIEKILVKSFWIPKWNILQEKTQKWQTGQKIMKRGVYAYFLQMQSKSKKSEKMTLFSLEMRELASNINS